jgi:hypothetical protein
VVVVVLYKYEVELSVKVLVVVTVTVEGALIVSQSQVTKPNPSEFQATLAIL